MSRNLVYILRSGLLALLAMSPQLAMAAGGGDEHGGNPLVDLGWRVVNFVIFVLILYFAASKPARNFLNGRIEGIRARLDEAERAKEAAEKRAADCLRKMERLEEEVGDIRNTLLREGEVEKERIVEAAHAAAEKIKVQAKFSAEQEMKKAVAAIKEETARAALKIAEDVISKELGKNDQKKLVSDYIENMRGVN